jgi:aminomethyltransferase
MHACRFFSPEGPSAVGRRTPLFELHQELSARIIDFGGWEMPLQYGSQIAEHHAVRTAAGVFDVSHMGIVDFTGSGARSLLARLLANDVGKLRLPGTALYSLMLNEGGGVLDDLIVYFIDEDWFRIVLNASTRDKDLAWMRPHAREFQVDMNERHDLAMLAIQGPHARAHVAQLLTPDGAQLALALHPFAGRTIEGWFIARTGYTGEDGFEVMLPPSDAVRTWRALNERGVVSCGLGARDTLRVEAGLCLYGSDMDERTHPYESGLGWTVAWEPASRQFIGREALEEIHRRGASRQLVGLLLESRGVLRAHQVILSAAGEGEVTSGTFSPTLDRSIGLARVPVAAPPRVQVELRGKLLDARIVKPPFVRHGKVLVA